MILQLEQKMRRTLAGAAFTGAGLLASFWALYAAGVLRPADPDDPIARYEASFPVADALLALALIAAGHGLLRRRAHGFFLLVAGAGMALYLGVLDLTFYAGRGAYSPPMGDAWIELAANAICVGGALWVLRLAWRAWTRSPGQERGVAAPAPPARRRNAA